MNAMDCAPTMIISLPLICKIFAAIALWFQPLAGLTECSQLGRQSGIAVYRNGLRIRYIYSGQFRKFPALDKSRHWGTPAHKRRN